MSQSRPLEGVKVVELATFIAAPCCCRYLADLGADVIKVEAPMGDPLRFTAVNEGRPFGDQEDTSYTLENAGKKFITLNIKSEKGRKVLEELISQADIFVTNNRLNALKKNGLDYETLHAKYPALVMGFISGYGEKGPDKDLPGFDWTAYFARSGVIGTMYDKDSLPMMPIAGFGDHQVGMNLASGLLAALYRAKTTGVGDQVIVSLFHSGVWDVSLYLQSAQYGVPTAQYPIHRYEQANLLQMAHKTKDGRFVMLAMPQYDKLYPKFVSEVLGREDLVGDERFYPQTNLQKHNKEFYDIMVSEIAKMTAQELMDKMKAADLPYSLCQNWQDLLVDEQAWASDILTKVKFPNGEERTMVRTPVLFSDTDLPPYERASFMGEQTREILGSLGYSEADVNAMIEAGDAQDVKRIG
jgi:cinnamoyl-CoA:phenyllactate CoA-transferase